MSAYSPSENPVREISLALDLGIEPSLFSVSVQDDGTLAVLPLPRVVTLYCYVDDIYYNISVTPNDMGDSGVIKIRGEVGIMPFTIESPDRRNAIRQIAQSTSCYEYGQLVINKYQKIIACSETQINHPPHLADVVTAIVRLKATLRPFLELIAEFLAEDGQAAITPKQQPSPSPDSAKAIKGTEQSIAEKPTTTDHHDQLGSRFSAFSIGFDDPFDDGSEKT